MQTDSCPVPNSQGRDSGWSSLGQVFAADPISYFQVSTWSHYTNNSHGLIPEDGELGPVVKGVILSWENTLIREQLNNYYDSRDSTTSDIGCSVIMLQFGV